MMEFEDDEWMVSGGINYDLISQESLISGLSESIQSELSSNNSLVNTSHHIRHGGLQR